MQKKIIALAIASAMTVPALAYADATVYGMARLSVDMVNDGAATTSASTNRLVSNNSRIGVKGSEDLGGGLSAIWQMEATVALDAGTDNTTTNTQKTSLFNRNTFLGLKSNDMGTLVLGLNDAPYKTSTRKLDVFIDTVAADNRGLAGVALMGGGSTGHDARRANSITYTSPSMSGMSFAAGSVFGAETATGVTGTQKKGSALSLAGMYEQGPIYATLAYDSLKYGDAGTGDLGGVADAESKAFKLGGSYSMDQITVNAVIEQDKATVAGTEAKGTNLYLAGKFGISSTDAVKLAYTKRGETESAGVKLGNDVSQFAVGYDHAMSKSTTVYALYTKLTDNGPNGTLTTNADPSTLSVGMNHSF